MKVLYFSYRYDPSQPQSGSSLDYEFYSQIKNIASDVVVFNPKLKNNGTFYDIIKRLYNKITGRKLLKFGLINSYQVSRQIKKIIDQESFDLIFTVFPNPLCFFYSNIPLIISLDTTFIGQQSQWKINSYIGMIISIWQEKRVFNHAKSIITYSEWCKKDLEKNYHISPEKIFVFPMPAAIPRNEIKNVGKNLNISPIRLLLVAREYYRKGVDIAIQVVNSLNASGFNSILTICGLEGKGNDKIRYVGPYNKSINSQLREYTNHYKQAHILIHPARFEAAGITPSEAAAYGTPTITNKIGGLNTTVKNGVSGYVLDNGLDYLEYVNKIIFLHQNPDIYKELCNTTLERYKIELSWEAHKKTIKTIFINSL